MDVLSFAGLSSGPLFSTTLIGCPWGYSSAPLGLRKTGFHRASVTRHSITENQVEDCCDRIAGRAGDWRGPFGIDACHFDCTQKVEDADDKDERRVLKQADIGVDNVRDSHSQRLWQDDQSHSLPVAQANR